MPVALEEYMTLEEAATALGVSEQTIRRYIRLGRLRGFKRPMAKGIEFVLRSEVGRLQEVIPVDRSDQAEDGGM